MSVSHHRLDSDPAPSPVAAAIAIVRKRLRAADDAAGTPAAGSAPRHRPLMSIEELRRRLEVGWSRDTSGAPELWSPQRPSTGQCSVSSLVAQRILGGEIHWTDVAGEAHYYNVVDGALLDLTADQFDGPVTYVRNRAEPEALLSDAERSARFHALFGRVVAANE